MEVRSMANYAKYTKAATGHLCKHYERAKDEKGEYIRFRNQEIDPRRTVLNYNLAPIQNQLEFIHRRLDEVYCLKRKDVNVMCSWVITVPKDLPADKEERFFQESYNFLEKKYGEENVVSSYVHKDEITPHMHFCFMPIVYDQKKQREKVSAKECVTRTDLQHFHTELEEYLESKLGKKINILNESTKNGNRAIIELKRGTAHKKLEKINEEVTKAADEIDKAELSLLALKAEYEARMTFVDQYIRESSLSMMYPEYAKVNKNLFGKETVVVPKEMWEKRHVSANLVSDFKKINEMFNSEILKLRLKILEPEKKVKALENECWSLRKENEDLKSKFRQAVKTIERVNKVLESSEEMRRMFLTVENQIYYVLY